MVKKVVLKYALTERDIENNELGEYMPLAVDKAFKIAKKMIEGHYVQVTITKVEG